MTLMMFAASPPGLEEITLGEMGSLDLLPPAEDAGSALAEGGVAFQGDLAALYRANLHLRSAGRILVRLSTFYATSFEQLFTNASRLPWERYVRPGGRVTLRVACHASRLYHSDAVAQEVLRALEARLGGDVQVAAGDPGAGEAVQRIVARLHRNRCTLSVDSSGENLHRRGYRLATAKAPLRENLAAGIILASGWDGRSPFLDPFCGSGRLAIEAALLAAGIPPGAHRRFAFMDWPGFDADLWDSVLAEGLRGVRTDLPPIAASDRDAGAVEAARANAARASVEAHIAFTCRAVSAITPVGAGWLVTNPPYGLRIGGGGDLRNLYAQFGNVLRQKCRGWRAAILCSDDSLLRQTRLAFDTGMWLTSGGIKVKLACANV